MASYEPFPQIEITIMDRALPLTDIEEFASEYSVTTGASVNIKVQWGGPAAGGPGWGGPEIAVLIVIGELLRRSTTDAYSLAKSFVLDIYSRIKTRNAARWYIDGAMALAVDNVAGTVRLIFCFPEGLDKAALEERVRLVESHHAALLEEWESRSPAEVKLCWREEEQKWVECEPQPEAEDDLIPPAR
ncbi:MAG: hypothetical protein IIC90_11870 [Chloroflexi bacterium]|nr:hypothetical protein [Chloroflexota bacterium]